MLAARCQEQRHRRRTRTIEQPRTHADMSPTTSTSRLSTTLVCVAEHEASELGPRSKVEQQTDLEVRGAKVVEQLLYVRLDQSLGRLELDDDLLLDDQVRAKVPDAQFVVPTSITFSHSTASPSRVNSYASARR